MKAMIFAAGTGSRLKPLTDHTPKALIPIGGKPILEHVILKLKSSGFDQIVINIHHLGNQIVDFLEANNNFGVRIEISDESDYLLDTGGGIKKATSLLCGNEPFLIHNVGYLIERGSQETIRYPCTNEPVGYLTRQPAQYLTLSII